MRDLSAHEHELRCAEFESALEELWYETFGHCHDSATRKTMPELQRRSEIVRCVRCKCLLRSAGRCTGCRRVAYCGRECQRAHWEAAHADVCPGALETADE